MEGIMDKVFVGLKAIAKRMKVSPSTILRWRRERGFPMYRVPQGKPDTWTTSNFLIYEWERNMVKLNWGQQFN